MALYAGETVRVKITATGFDQEPILPAQVVDTEATFFDAAGDVIHGPVSILWEPDREYWYVDWMTDPEAHIGTFRVKTHFIGLTFDTWEVVTIRLRRSPV